MALSRFYNTVSRTKLSRLRVTRTRCIITTYNAIYRQIFLIFLQNEARLEVIHFLSPTKRYAEFKLLPPANVDNDF